MRILRRIRLLAVPLALVASLGAVASADASSLLSGYGGPGQGNQAILGSALLNGPSGGGGRGSGGGGSGGGGGASEAAGSTAASSGAQGPTGSASSTAGNHAAFRASRHKGVSSTAGRTSSAPATALALRQASAAVKDGSQPLGLSGRDIFYALLALIVLAGTGGLTLRLARPDSSSTTKGMRARTRVTE